MSNDAINDFFVNNPLSYYMNKIGSFELLTVEEERELLKKAKNGDEEARDRLILCNLRLVVNIAKRYKNRGIPFMDLIQEGNIGLMKALDRFDISNGTKFSTYATWWILQSVVFAIYNDSELIKKPFYLRQRADKLIKVENQLTGKLGRKPMVEEIAEEMNLSIDNVNKINYYIKRPLSLDEYIDDDHDTTLGDYLEDSNALSPIEELNKKEQTEEINNSLSNLTYREELVIRYRYGLNDEDAKILNEVADIMGLTRARVSMIQKNAEKVLRSNSEKLALHMSNPDYSLKKSEEFKKNNFVGKGMDKSICKYFDNYSRSDVIEVLSTLSMEEINILRLKYGKDLGTTTNYVLSREEEFALNNLYIKIEYLLNNLNHTNNTLIRKRIKDNKYNT